MRIAIIVNGRYAEEEIELRRRYFQSKASSGTTIELLFPENAPLRTREARPPTAEELYAVGTDVVLLAKRAEAKGFDAVVIYNSYDPGADAAMSMVSIPVVGAGRAACYTAAMLADKLCIVAPYNVFIPLTYRWVSAIGFAHRITPIRAIDIPVGLMKQRKAEAIKRFLAIAMKGIEEGAQVIVPQGLNSFLVHAPIDELEDELNCPIIDAVPLAIRYAEIFVNLGLGQSRRAYPLFTQGKK